MDTFPIRSKRTCCRRPTTEGAEKRCGIDDSAATVETVPAIETIFADALIAAAPTTCRKDLRLGKSIET
jgi:hypothetical protein